MAKTSREGKPSRSATQSALRRAAASKGLFLRAEDVEGTPPAAAAKALNRLAKKGVLTRAAKGLYYSPRETLLGPSRPTELGILMRTIAGRTRPTGTTAANLLGMSTQVPARPEFALYASAKPKHAAAAALILRKGAHAGRLPTEDAALLEFLRDRGAHGELDAETMLDRLRTALVLPTDKAPDRLPRLVSVAAGEPPRVRAILGALLQWSGAPSELCNPLRESLNPATRFNFGPFAALPNAKDWQAN